MEQAPMMRHRCYRCCPHGAVLGDSPELESIATTFAEGGGDVFFTAGYSAREIAQNRARESGSVVYVNSVSRNIKRRDLSAPVGYAVARTPVYTLFPPDEYHESIYRAYWPPL
jgi:hypothetical protein